MAPERCIVDLGHFVDSMQRMTSKIVYCYQVNYTIGEELQRVQQIETMAFAMGYVDELQWPLPIASLIMGQTMRLEMI